MEATTVLETEPGLMDGLLDTPVIIRTVTHYYTGQLIAYDGELLQLNDAAWVPRHGPLVDRARAGHPERGRALPGRPGGVRRGVSGGGHHTVASRPATHG